MVIVLLNNMIITLNKQINKIKLYLEQVKKTVQVVQTPSIECTNKHISRILPVDDGAIYIPPSCADLRVGTVERCIDTFSLDCSLRNHREASYSVIYLMHH